VQLDKIAGLDDLSDPTTQIREGDILEFIHELDNIKWSACIMEVLDGFNVQIKTSGTSHLGYITKGFASTLGSNLVGTITPVK
jgi:hypothetical protein